MLRPGDVRDLVRKQPFSPFRVHTSDHEHFDVMHPDLIMMVGERSLTIGIPSAESGVYSRQVIVTLAHVTRIDPEIAVPG